jgi:DNA-binding SARP family transcriptional activator
VSSQVLDVRQVRLTATVLGPVRLWREFEEVDLRPRQVRAITGLLLTQHGQLVPIDDLVSAMWPDKAPATARNIVHQHIGALRRHLEPDLAPRGDGHWVQRIGAGYRFRADDLDLDLDRSRLLVGQASLLAEEGLQASALRARLQALQLWQDWSATTLEPAMLTGPTFTRLDEELSRLAIDTLDLAMATGDARSVLSPLGAVADRRPLDETLQARFILCLAAAGRHPDAVRRYQRIQQTLFEIRGVQPGVELGAARDRLRQARSTRPGKPPGINATQPSQLPADLYAFTGRGSELAQLDHLAALASSTQHTKAVAGTVDGMPGVGKSTLAVHWAHGAARSFPDGQIYIDLRGHQSTGPMDAAQAVRVLLSALGCPPDAMPRQFAAQIGLYRTLLSKRRVLIILDNAASSELVSDLIPGAPGCMTVVTSRIKLTSLAACGAHSITLGLLTDEEARHNLSLRITAMRAVREPGALADIARHCDGLPLAVAIAAARIAANPHFRLADVRDELTQSHGALDGFSLHDDGSDLRRVFAWSYHQLPARTREFFRRLACHSAAELSVEAAGNLDENPVQPPRQHLQDLTQAGLLSEVQPGHYRMHSLLRAYGQGLDPAG